MWRTALLFGVRCMVADCGETDQIRIRPERKTEYETYKKIPNLFLKPDPKPANTPGSAILRHGTYIRWYLRKRCALKEQSLLIGLFKAFH